MEAGLDLFDPAAEGWERLIDDSILRRRFDMDGVYHYSQMLQRQMSGEIDSWAIRWYWTVFKATGIVLFRPTCLSSILAPTMRLRIEVFLPG